MKYGGPYRIHDCKRTLKAIADAGGRILYLYENAKKPQAEREPGKGRKQNVHPHYTGRKEKSQCRK